MLRERRQGVAALQVLVVQALFLGSAAQTHHVLLKLLHEPVCFVFGVIDELEADLFHRQVEGAEVTNGFVPDPNLDLPIL